MRSPLLVIFVLYVGPMPFLVVPASGNQQRMAAGGRGMSLTNETAPQLDFFQAINQLVYIEDDVGPVRDEDAAFSLQAMLLQRLEFVEEARDVDDTAAPNDIDAAGID